MGSPTQPLRSNRLHDIVRDFSYPVRQGSPGGAVEGLYHCIKREGWTFVIYQRLGMFLTELVTRPTRAFFGPRTGCVQA